MKKQLCVLLAAMVAALPLAAAGCTPRAQVLKIYNWGDYIDEDLIGEFEDWYKRETGETVRVQYDTFDTNETMIMRIEKQKADYDLVCPSDYVAQQMIKQGLAKKIDTSIFDMNEEGLFYDGLSELITFDANNEYYVPYVWGTVGIMYDTNHIVPGSPDAMLCESWDAMWSGRWQQISGKKRVLMKDSVRDAYSIACIYTNRDKLSELSNDFTDYNEEYRNELKKYFNYTDDSLIASAQRTLIAQKPVLYKYEVDDGKNDMLAGTTDAWLGMFWSCDVELIMWEPGGEHFYYTVPKEGSNVWVDGWLIPKYSKNTKAANYFLKFINSYEYAYKNFDYLGNSIAVKSVMDDVREEYLSEENEFFDDKYPGFKEMFIDALFPPPEVLSRCAVMSNFERKWNTALDGMWIDVKTA